jgi:hypothetical protein
MVIRKEARKVLAYFKIEVLRTAIKFTTLWNIQNTSYSAQIVTNSLFFHNEFM